MTVAELITLLRMYDPDSGVVLSSETRFGYPLALVYEAQYLPINDFSGHLMEKEEAPGSIDELLPVVVLGDVDE